jgi:hypothetical protein
MPVPALCLRGRLSKAHSGPIFDNRIFNHDGPQAGSVLGAVSEPESRFGLVLEKKIKKNSQNEVNPTTENYG